MKDETLASMGKLLDKDMPRDAVHIACVPVIAAHALRPGDHVGLSREGKATALTEDTIGIIDPYLRHLVQAGQRCWLFLYPGSITSLKHLWTHPAFPETESAAQPAMVTSLAFGDKSAAENWLRHFASSWGMDYDNMIDQAKSGSSYLIARNNDIHSWDEVDSDDRVAFWRNMEILTGEVYDSHHRESVGFSCSC